MLGYDSFAPCFSSAGEDMILRHILGSEKRGGFFVDVGAFHPVRASNTYFFYLQDWRGINIDACPGSMDAFKKLRPRDVNLELGISDEPGELTYYVIDKGSSMNTFSRDFLAEVGLLNEVKSEVRIPVKTLASVLEEHVPKGQVIDFMTVDVEGFDLKVLRSNDWTRFRPHMVVVEDLVSHDRETPQVVRFLEEQGYDVVATNIIILDKINEYFFMDRNYRVNGAHQ